MTTMPLTREQGYAIAEVLPNDTLKAILNLRATGCSNYDISEELNLPYPFVVQFAIQRALKHEHGEAKKVKRQAEENRLERLFQQAQAAFTATGSGDWYDRLLKTSERKSKLLGLDAPVETVLTGAKGGPVQFQTLNLKGLTDEELATMKALALKSAGGTSADSDE